MNLDTIANLREQLHPYIGERRNDQLNLEGSQKPRCYYNCGQQGHFACDGQMN